MVDGKYRTEALNRLASVVGFSIHEKDKVLSGYGTVNNISFPCGMSFDDAELTIVDSICCDLVVGIWVVVGNDEFSFVLVDDSSYKRVVMYYVDCYSDDYPISVFENNWSRLGFYKNIELNLSGIYVWSERDKYWKDYSRQIGGIGDFISVRKNRQSSSKQAVQLAGLNFLTDDI